MGRTSLVSMWIYLSRPLTWGEIEKYCSRWPKAKTYFNHNYWGGGDAFVNVIQELRLAELDFSIARTLGMLALISNLQG